MCVRVGLGQRHRRQRRYVPPPVTLGLRPEAEWYEDCADIAITGTGKSLTGPKLIRYNVQGGPMMDPNKVPASACCLSTKKPGKAITVKP